ncbi:MAG TPA: hypothetical protein VF245_08070 [Solirubrobacterales bacterium]
MKRLGIAPIVALGIALLGIALSGCGGSGSGTESSPTTGAESQAGGRAEAKKSREGNSTEGAESERGGKGGSSTGSGSKVQAAPLKVSGGGSAQYRAPGGDNSVQNFGEESDETELEEAATALHDYLVARAGEDWTAACANLSKSVGEQLQTLASHSEGLSGKGCAAILGALTPKLPPSVRRESTIVDAGSLRLEGEQAFLIYRGAEEKTYTVLMAPEDGAWKVGSLAATPLS